MILDMRYDEYERSDAKEATVIVNASLSEFTDNSLECSNAKIISFDTFRDESVCNATKLKEFLEEREFFCPNLEIIDLSRACPPDIDLNDTVAKRFNRFVKELKEKTDIDIVATPELEKLFPILLPKDEEDDNLLEDYVIPLKEEKYSSLQAITKLQLAQAEEKLSPELYREILEHSNNNVVAQGVISAIDKQLSKGTEQLEQYVSTLLGCIAGRYITQDNFDTIVDIAEKHIAKDDITIEDINFCFGLQKESSKSEEAYQRINNLIKGLIPHLPEEVRQELDAKAALKEKKQQEYIQKRQQLQAKVDEYSGYLILSDAAHKDVSGEHIRRVADTIYENAGKYPELYTDILTKIYDEKDEYKIKAAAHWIRPIIFRINTLGLSETDKTLLRNLTDFVTDNQDVRHEFGHIFCQQLKKGNDSDYWLNKIDDLLDNNNKDHILLMNTYEDMEQAFKLHPELITDCLAIFQSTLKFPRIGKGFNDHLHTLASIVGDTANEHPEFSDKAMDILSDLSQIEKNLSDSSSKSYLRSKIDEAFNKIKQNDIASSSKRNLLIFSEKNPTAFADVVKELINDPHTEQQHIEKAIEMRLISGLDVLANDYDSEECLKWNLSVLRSKALQNKGPEEISACAEKIFKNGILKKLEENPDYDTSEMFQAIYDAAPFWLKKLRENISDEQDLLILQNMHNIPKEVQKLYVCDNLIKIDNLIKTNNLENFPEVVAQKLKLEVCDYLSDISSEKTFIKKRSISGMKTCASLLKEINGYSSPEACVLALNEALRMRSFISKPSSIDSCRCARRHFLDRGEDIKPFVKISTDIIDNVFEQIRQHNDSSLTDVLKDTQFSELNGKCSLPFIMGPEATKAFLSGDENYKVLWDKETVERHDNAYLMLEKKPYEILQDLPFDKKKDYLDKMDENTFNYKDIGNDFPELSKDGLSLSSRIRYCSSKDTDEDLVQAVKTFCKARVNDKISDYYKDYDLVTLLMEAYDIEYKKGIEDKELFSILYKIRFDGYASFTMREHIEKRFNDKRLTAPKLKSLGKTSFLLNKWQLKKGTNEK